MHPVYVNDADPSNSEYVFIFFVQVEIVSRCCLLMPPTDCVPASTMQIPVIQNISIFAAGKNWEKILLVDITHRLCTRLNDSDPSNSEYFYFCCR